MNGPDRLALGLILLVAAVLRVWGLEYHSLDHDELSSWYTATWPTLRSSLEERVVLDVHPPLHPILQYVSVRIVGDSEAALRGHSVLWGWLTVLLTWAIGRRLYSSLHGLGAAGIMAVLAIPIHYSQQARMYSLLMLVVCLMAYGWIGLYHAYRDRSDLPASDIGHFLLGGLLAEYTHYFGLMFVGSLGIAAAAWLLISRRFSRLFSLAAMGTVFLLAYLPWMPVMIQHLGQSFWITTPSILLFPEFNGWLLNSSVGLLTLATGAVAAATALTVLNYRTDERFRRPHRLVKDSDWIVVLWIVIPFTFTFAVSVVSTPILTRQNLLISAPAVILLLVRSLAVISPHRTSLRALIAGVIVTLGAHTLLIYRYHTTPQRPQFREASQALATRLSTEDPRSVVVLCHGAAPGYFGYYLKRFHSSLTPYASTINDSSVSPHRRAVPGPGSAPSTIGPLDQVLQPLISTGSLPPTIAYLVAHQPLPAQNIDFIKNLGYRQTWHLRFHGAGVWRFDRR